MSLSSALHWDMFTQLPSTHKGICNLWPAHNAQTEQFQSLTWICFEKQLKITRFCLLAGARNTSLPLSCMKIFESTLQADDHLLHG